jgi:hypothetical protein
MHAVEKKSGEKTKEAVERIRKDGKGLERRRKSKGEKES